jgi:hypothetical protein
MEVNIPVASSGALKYEKTELERSKLPGIQPEAENLMKNCFMCQECQAPGLMILAKNLKPLVAGPPYDKSGGRKEDKQNNPDDGSDVCLVRRWPLLLFRW